MDIGASFKYKNVSVEYARLNPIISATHNDSAL
jgi:hypothetical protein